MPGTSGNLGGRAKGFRRLADDLYKVLAEPTDPAEMAAAFEAMDIPDDVQVGINASGDRQEAFARLLVYRTLVGSWMGADQIFGRLCPIPARTEISGPGGGPIVSAGMSLAGSAPADAAAIYHALVRGEEVADETNPDGADSGVVPGGDPESRE